MTPSSLRLLVLALAISGCGYSLAGRGSFLPDNIQTIAVPPFDSLVPRSELVEELTRAVTREFIERGGYRITPIAAGADAVLVGSVVGLTETPIAFDDEGRETRSVLAITTSVKLRTVADEEVIYENPAFLFRREIEVEPEDDNVFDPQSVAIQELAREFARSLVATIVEGF